MPKPDDLQLTDDQSPPPSSPLNESTRGRVTIKTEASLSYNSPLAPPEIIAGYARILPDAPERILAMVERQEAHRQLLEKTVVEAGVNNASKAITVTAYISTLFVAASVYMVHEHYVVYGIVTLGSTLATLAGVNFYGKAAQKNERAEKAKRLTEDDQSRRRRRQLAQGEAQNNPEKDEKPQTSDEI